jgi:uncharacterized RDD family membrane protein YckC
MSQSGSSWQSSPGTPGSPPVGWVAPPPDEGPAPGVAWGGYGERFLAYLIDGFVVSLLFIVPFLVLLGTAFGTADFSDPDNPQLGAGAAAGGVVFVILILMATVVGLAYFPFFWARSGQTPGMRLFGLRVVRDSDGGPISGGSAVLRVIGLWVAGAVFYLGFIWVFIDKRRRGWHDLMAGTVVIKDPGR